MNSSDFFSILTMVILMLFSGVFLGLYLYDRKHHFPAWVSAAYAAALLAYLTDINRTIFSSITADYISNTFFWMTAICIVMAVCTRLRRPVPVLPIAIALLAGLAAQSWFSFVDDDLIMRSMVANMFSAFVLMAVLPTLWQSATIAIDRAIFWVTCVLVGSYLLRPIIIFMVMGETHTHESYTGSTEALAQQMTIAVASLAGAVTLLIAAGYDIVVRTQQMNVIDPLTGVLNRRGYEEMLEETGANADEQLVGRAVMMFDVDAFKQVNDNYGHHTGDAVLARMAATAKAVIEHHGQVARVGGEEFAVILNGTSSAVAHEITEHLRLAFGLLVHPELPPGASITASFGIAHTQDGETLKRTLRRADMALYAAKDRGRNRIVDSANLRREVPVENVA